MKTNRIKNRNYKLFKYNLLKLQIYSNEPFFNVAHFSNNILEQIEVYLKQALTIIYKYHVYQFNILFIGFPIVSKAKQMKLIHFTNHNFIPEKSWISGIFRNRFSILTYLKLMQSQNITKSLKVLLKITTKPHLVVIFNSRIETSTINEFYKAGIPILAFDWNSLNIFKIAYKALGNYSFIEKNIKSTFFFLFYSLLKKMPTKKINNKKRWFKLFSKKIKKS